MPRQRKPENKGLPARWQRHHGAYYYFVPPGLESYWDGKRKFRLGTNLPEAYRAWADRLGTLDKAGNIGELLDRYALEVIPAKAPTTQSQNQIAVARLRKTFAAWPLTAVEPHHIYTYVDARTKTVKSADGQPLKVKARTAAMREIEVLSHAFTKAVEWGYLKRHPFAREVRLPGEKPRDRYVEDWEIEACLSIDSKRKKGSVLAAQAYVRLKLLTGMARGDLLRLPVPDFTSEGIEIQRHKTAKSTAKRTIYLWTDALRTAVHDAIAARPNSRSSWLFCNRRGECYINEETGRAGGWASLWRGFMDRVMAETEVKVRFNEHDIRAKVASDAETVEHASALLSHANISTTKRIYRRKAERVIPLDPKDYK
ncbi:tyrosine-type recombinase/integrase [Jeongeupia naejangsanensis]|uniref:Tyrosine-type recombinase/integrase n=1 Tax=Jeongeupia naejangsanensis TaxID=613195 RepID=A0ABS2BID2_9NEIS|nr:tyrosine-type recombinase/integrase [Jeongeupia naejangsanensis]MBM3114574.1 tyrosine-type recombinase/integrase [Jeongeupia naejangsanensis]